MSLGDRIQYFRTLRGMTQKELGMRLGFPENSAVVRIAQYENESRTPKDDVIAALAKALDVAPAALTAPKINTVIDLMHNLFALEENINLKVCKCDGELHLRLEPKLDNASANASYAVSLWLEQAAKLEDGTITKAEYDQWRYNFPYSANVFPWWNLSNDAAGKSDTDPFDALMAKYEKTRKRKKRTTEALQDNE